MAAILNITRIVIAIITIGIGVFSLLFPKRVKGFTGLEMPGPRGISEVRAILGGLFIGLGLTPLIYAAPEAWKMLGLTYAGIGAARLFSIFYDKSYEQSNIISVVSEVLFAVILLI